MRVLSYWRTFCVFGAGALLAWVFTYNYETGKAWYLAKERADVEVQSTLAEMCFYEFDRSLTSLSEGEKKQRQLYAVSDKERRDKFIAMLDSTRGYLRVPPDVRLDYIEPCMERFLLIRYDKYPDAKGVH